MRHLTVSIVLAPVLLVGCSHRTAGTRGTLAELRDVPPDVQEAQVQQGLEQAMDSYRRFLEEAPETAMTPEAMRRLADLQIERQFGIGGGERLPQPAAAAPPARRSTDAGRPDSVAESAVSSLGESDAEFEARTTAAMPIPVGAGSAPAGPETDPAGPLEAIALYDRLLTEYPRYENSDQVLYQMARAYDELGRTDEAMEVMRRLIDANPGSPHYDEVQFRRAEYFFTRKRYLDAEGAYSAIIRLGARSSYYDLALYKLGWTFYKQELYEEALHQYMALLDYTLSIGYDFDQTRAEDEERRVTDTYRAISLSFSYLGGSDTVSEYFSTFGNRTYEDRVYANLGEHYLAKLRYDDAAKAYRTFEALYPFHRAAPHFSMRVVDVFTLGGFSRLVLEAKREFASRYGLQAEYWRSFAPEDSPDVLAYLKANLNDLATHYHAEYQNSEDPGVKIETYNEALRWYGDYLGSFPADEDAPSINYRFADLLLEHEDFGEAAAQYERTAYEYSLHPQASAAGYAAVYAYREQLNAAVEEQRDVVRRNAIASSLRFADTFPEHEQAAPVLGAAADDLYEVKDYPAAVDTGWRVIDAYPYAEPHVRRGAWIVVAHGSFDLAQYSEAEVAYTQVLSLTPGDDESHAAFVENLAASVYRQGELASDAGDYRAAADHFLRIRSAAPTSSIRPSAEYDAGAALMALEDWPEAARVFEAFRSAFPSHELHRDATRQIAYAYREAGELARAAQEYDRFATESGDPALRSEALRVAGDLYEQSDAPERALDVYARYVDEFDEPVETNLETRFRMAEIHKAADAEWLYHDQLAWIVRIDAEAGPARTGRTRTLGARSALVLAEQVYEEFTSIELLQPFETSLEEKQQRMDETIEAMGGLVAYEIAEVTSAATYYMAETYSDFSRSLIESERPADLEPSQLAEYESGLDGAAFPFEERAIEVHEENIELLHAGVFNEWTEMSLGRLTELMPGRYAKDEISTGFLGPANPYQEPPALPEASNETGPRDGGVELAHPQ
jgi:tetratricopeptide (TPR) repeat protein